LEQALAFFNQAIRGLLAFATFSAIGAINADLADTLGASAGRRVCRRLEGISKARKRDRRNDDHSFHGFTKFLELKNQGTEATTSRRFQTSYFFNPLAAAAPEDEFSPAQTPRPNQGRATKDPPPLSAALVEKSPHSRAPSLSSHKGNPDYHTQTAH
jgi:hypothetical protein